MELWDAKLRLAEYKGDVEIQCGNAQAMKKLVSAFGASGKPVVGDHNPHAVAGTVRSAAIRKIFAKVRQNHLTPNQKPRCALHMPSAKVISFALGDCRQVYIQAPRAQGDGAGPSTGDDALRRTAIYRALEREGCVFNPQELEAMYHGTKPAIARTIKILSGSVEVYWLPYTVQELRHNPLQVEFVIASFTSDNWMAQDAIYAYPHAIMYDICLIPRIQTQLAAHSVRMLEGDCEVVSVNGGFKTNLVVPSIAKQLLMGPRAVRVVYTVGDDLGACNQQYETTLLHVIDKMTMGPEEVGDQTDTYLRVFACEAFSKVWRYNLNVYCLPDLLCRLYGGRIVFITQEDYDTFFRSMNLTGDYKTFRELLEAVGGLMNTRNTIAGQMQRQRLSNEDMPVIKFWAAVMHLHESQAGIDMWKSRKRMRARVNRMIEKYLRRPGVQIWAQLPFTDSLTQRKRIVRGHDANQFAPTAGIFKRQLVLSNSATMSWRVINPSVDGDCVKVAFEEAGLFDRTLRTRFKQLKSPIACDLSALTQLSDIELTVLAETCGMTVVSPLVDRRVEARVLLDIRPTGNPSVMHCSVVSKGKKLKFRDCKLGLTHIHSPDCDGARCAVQAAVVALHNVHGERHIATCQVAHPTRAVAVPRKSPEEVSTNYSASTDLGESLDHVSISEKTASTATVDVADKTHEELIAKFSQSTKKVSERTLPFLSAAIALQAEHSEVLEYGAMSPAQCSEDELFREIIELLKSVRDAAREERWVKYEEGSCLPSFHTRVYTKLIGTERYQSLGVHDFAGLPAAFERADLQSMEREVAYELAANAMTLRFNGVALEGAAGAGKSVAAFFTKHQEQRRLQQMVRRVVTESRRNAAGIREALPETTQTSTHELAFLQTIGRRVIVDEIYRFGWARLLMYLAREHTAGTEITIVTTGEEAQCGAFGQKAIAGPLLSKIAMDSSHTCCECLAAFVTPARGRKMYGKAECGAEIHLLNWNESLPEKPEGVNGVVTSNIKDLSLEGLCAPGLQGTRVDWMAVQLRHTDMQMVDGRLPHIYTLLTRFRCAQGNKLYIRPHDSRTRDMLLTWAVNAGPCIKISDGKKRVMFDSSDDEGEKPTNAASLTMRKMGHQDGDGLGRNKQGITEPEGQFGRTGLGFKPRVSSDSKTVSFGHSRVRERTELVRVDRDQSATEVAEDDDGAGPSVPQVEPVAVKRTVTLTKVPVVPNAASLIMRKMGYRDGDGLGRNKQGITAPIELAGQFGRTGLGFKPRVSSDSEPVSSGRSRVHERQPPPQTELVRVDRDQSAAEVTEDDDGAGPSVPQVEPVAEKRTTTLTKVPVMPKVNVLGYSRDNCGDNLTVVTTAGVRVAETTPLTTLDDAQRMRSRVGIIKPEDAVCRLDMHRTEMTAFEQHHALPPNFVPGDGKITGLRFDKQSLMEALEVEPIFDDSMLKRPPVIAQVAALVDEGTKFAPKAFDRAGRNVLVWSLCKYKTTGLHQKASDTWYEALTALARAQSPNYEMLRDKGMIPVEYDFNHDIQDVIADFLWQQWREKMVVGDLSLPVVEYVHAAEVLAARARALKMATSSNSEFQARELRDEDEHIENDFANFDIEKLGWEVSAMVAKTQIKLKILQHGMDVPAGQPVVSETRERMYLKDDGVVAKLLPAAIFHVMTMKAREPIFFSAMKASSVSKAITNFCRVYQPGEYRHARMSDVTAMDSTYYHVVIAFASLMVAEVFGPEAGARMKELLVRSVVKRYARGRASGVKYELVYKLPSGAFVTLDINTMKILVDFMMGYCYDFSKTSSDDPKAIKLTGSLTAKSLWDIRQLGPGLAQGDDAVMTSRVSFPKAKTPSGMFFPTFKIEDVIVDGRTPLEFCHVIFMADGPYRGCYVYDCFRLAWKVMARRYNISPSNSKVMQTAREEIGIHRDSVAECLRGINGPEALGVAAWIMSHRTGRSEAYYQDLYQQIFAYTNVGCKTLVAMFEKTELADADFC